MKTLFKLVAPAIVLLSCQQTVPPEKERPVQIDTMQLIAPPAQSAVKVASNEVSVVSRDSTTYVRFGDCYFSLDWITPNTQRNDFELHPDTIFFTLAPKRTIEGQMIAITTGESEKIKVAQSYETSMVAGHQLLRKWKHHRGAWEHLTAEANNFYICRKYSASERSRFPETTLADLQLHANKTGNKELVRAVSLLDTLPKAAISSYFLRVNGTIRNSPLRINKVLIIDVTL
ncbi:hypothetical protein [Chitinophaga solisilvae]|uniref:Uncharacterized protein n=1 Tax=Chitinophaga solisilvae TaxID=1233460 RepID=A0A9Q5GUG1_9BACT|nr:hypothetical protein [Chitinophaga solisilvae]NSL89524.1 hypothetical protein [Chitinophaga solisilvae]